MTIDCDAVVVGGGPAGCATALSLARAGKDVLLLEAAGEPTGRLAGEWIHPAGVRTLERLGVDLSSLRHGQGRGFVAFPDDGSAPVVLTYPDSARARMVEHRHLVTALQDAARAHPRITFTTSARATQIEEGRIHYLDTAARTRHTATAPLLVGADGRSSLVRRSLGLELTSTPLSRTAGFLLRDVELPYEEFGHVLLGGPGPVLLYRIAPGLVRVSIDVPADRAGHFALAPYLGHHYTPHVPPGLLHEFETAIASGAVQWAANRTAPRACYGRQGRALVGDATGYLHPLTAAGLSLAFADAECLAQAPSVEVYAGRRRTQTMAAELLASGLYAVLARPGAGNRALRRSVYRRWRNADQSAATLSLLNTEECRVSLLWRVVLGTVLDALGCALGDLAGTRGRTALAVLGSTVAEGVALLRWLAASTLRRSAGGGP